MPRELTRSERKPNPLRGGSERQPHPADQRRWLSAFTMVTPAENVRRGTQDGEPVAVGLGSGSTRWRNGSHTVPERASTRPARGVTKQPWAGLNHTATRCGGVVGRWPGPRSREHRETSVAGSGYGLRRRIRQPPHGAKPEFREPESPRGETCHRVWYYRDAHHEWTPPASAVGGSQTTHSLLGPTTLNQHFAEGSTAGRQSDRLEGVPPRTRARDLPGARSQTRD